MTKGQRIKAKRSELGISQVELANKIGVSKQTLYKYENDIITNIPSDNVEKLSAALCVSPAWIMGFNAPAAIVPTPEETELLRAYRNSSEEIKTAACAVLGINRKKDSSTLSKAE